MSEKTFSVNSELLNNCCEESNSVGQDDLHDKITSPVDRNMSDQANKRHHDVFISYASENKTVADAIVADFEQNGIRCWYAPRDIRAGENYMDALIGAIEEAWVVVLVYSEESNQSKYVLNEVTAAFEAGKTIVPFRLTDTQMRPPQHRRLLRISLSCGSTCVPSYRISTKRQLFLRHSLFRRQLRRLLPGIPFRVIL